MIGWSGWKSAIQSVAQTVAQLVGQDIVARSISLTQTATNVAVQLVSGARLKLGTGTTDYLISAGSSLISAAGDFSVGTSSALYLNGSTATVFVTYNGTNVRLVNPGGKVIVEGDATSPARSAFSILPQDTEPTGPNVVGDLYVNSGDSKLYLCTVAGTPGTWVVVGTQS